MTDSGAAVAGGTRWDAIARAPALTAAEMDEALTAMELTRARYMEEHRPAVEHIAALAERQGLRPHAVRAQLIIADLAARTGDPLPQVLLIDAHRAWALDAGQRAIVARAHFLLTMIYHAVGDAPGAQINGIRSLEYLPEDAPAELRIDYLTTLAVTYDTDDRADQCYQQALDLATVLGDTARTGRVYNNLAFLGLRRKDLPSALHHVDNLLRLAESGAFTPHTMMLATIAEIYVAAGRLTEAREVLDRALDPDPPRDSSGGNGGTGSNGGNSGGHARHTETFALPECLVISAQVHRARGDLDTAQESIDRALELSRARNLGPTVARARREQALLFAAQGDYRRAFHEHEAFHAEVVAQHSRAGQVRARLAHMAYSEGTRQADEVQFRELAIRDPLTGLYNRRFIDEQLASLTARAAEKSDPLSVAIADIDYFKRVNDELSHETGDRVLQQLARLLQGAVVAPESVARFGGEEFVFILPNVPSESAFARCERVRGLVAAHDWTRLVGAIPVTVSIGVSTATGPSSPSALLSAADRNLYAAKRSGRNRVMGDPL